ncbi:hypothetical protein [Cardinium endosymbiont of Culicoides punctatus]|uniref:alpha/beta hydrolase n=1 Tax=Cardinium endosymbiont of Culicoides punctatus TaxID=2304601 RepID=UPI0010D0F899|nr:hypothetical protein [Cardinium endosymbiont of Culicoides punctatus]TDG95531.1 hypothetical protein CCPUN_02670 [Cardinium endosymbiont of Culicoides punctatus]
MKPTTIKCIFLIYFAISIFVGCKNHTSTLQMGLGSSKQSEIENTSYVSEATHNKHFGVVLLHGCMGTEKELDLFALALDKKFGDRVLIIKPTCRKETKSVICSIEDQAKKVFEEIENVLKNNNKTIKSFPVFLIGYSQGGLVACVLGDQYKNKLNIRSIVTWHSPLGGVPVLERNCNDIKEFINEGQDGLKNILSSSDASPDLNTAKKEMKQQACILSIGRILSCWNRGLQDMLPGGLCIQDIRKFIRETNQGIPILIIAGHGSWTELFKINDSNIETLNQASANFLTKNSNGKHDMLIPLKSQLCRGPSFDDLTILTNDNEPIHGTMPGKDHVKYCIYSNVTHSSVFPAFGGICVNKDDYDKVSIWNEAVENRIIEFIQGHFSDANKADINN